jgi:plastocyanin
MLTGRSELFWIYIIVLVIMVLLSLRIDIPLISVQGQTLHYVKIISGASNPDNKLWYDPQIKPIKKGDSVIWINQDSSLHTVTSGTFYQGPTPDYDSGILNSNLKSKPWTFNSNGTFNYYCTLHPFMFGQILVQP